MRLRIADLWSPDLNPPSEGLPASDDFDLLLQVSISENGAPGHEVFSCRVCTAEALAGTPDGKFVAATLVLETFSWGEVRDRLQKRLRHCDGCATWGEVIARLRPFLSHNDS